MHNDSTLKRREFTKLTAAAFGGMLAGAAPRAASAQEDRHDGKLTMDPALLAEEPHVCRGLNNCQGKGKGGDNSCAGQGNCAAVDKHSCGGENDCKGKGGCGGYPGQNTCSGKGHCAVPLKEKVWETARKQFEEVRKDLGQKVGPAPQG